MIGLSINEDLKLEKGKGKKSSAARYFIWSSGHVTAYCPRLSKTVCNCPPQSTVFHQCRNTIPVLSRNRKSTSFPFFIQNSFFKEREDSSCLYISFLSTLYRLQSSSKCLGVCIKLHSLKHLPSLSFPIILEKDLK